MRVDRDWCKYRADRFGVNSLTLEENLLGETVETAYRILGIVEAEERHKRQVHGVQYTFKNFSHARALRRVCKARKLGGWKESKV